MSFVNQEGDRTWTTEDFEKALKALHEAGVNPGTLFCQGQGGDQGTRAFISNLYGAEIANADMTEYTMNSEAGVKRAWKLRRSGFRTAFWATALPTTEAAISSCSKTGSTSFYTLLGVPPRSL